METDSGWKAGAAQTIITPEEPMWMAGFGFREGPAEGTERDLTASALALEDVDGNHLVILSAELLFIGEGLRSQVLSRVDIADAELFVTATHTHCGPEIRPFKIDMYADDPGQYHDAADRYRASLVDAFVGVIEEAQSNQSPADLSYDHARCGFAMNRRRPSPEGINHIPNPDGPVDHDVPVLVVRKEDTVDAIVFGYACHPTTVMRCEGWMAYHGDWAGFAQEIIQEDYPDATALFVQGCAGDQNTYPRGSLELAKQYGQSMANAVRVAVDCSRTSLHGPLRTSITSHSIELETPPTEEMLQEQLHADDRVTRVRAESLLAELEEHGSIPQTASIPIQGIGFGNQLAILVLGGEVLVEYSHYFDTISDVPCWVAGYANSDFTYVPTAQARIEGGYEGDHAFRYAALGGAPTPAIERRLQRAGRSILSQVSGPS